MKVSIALFACLFVLPWVAWGCLKVAAKGNDNLAAWVNMDSGENRNLNRIEDLSVENFTEQVENYYNDRVPFRSQLLAVDRRWNAYLDKLYVENVLQAFSKNVPAQEEVVLGETEQEGEETIAEEESPYPSETIKEQMEAYSALPFYAPFVANNCVIVGRNDWLYYALDEIPRDFTGEYQWPDEQMQYFMGLMQQIQDLCDAKGIRLVFLFYPNKSQIYAENMPTFDIVDPYRRMDRFVDYVREHSEMEVVYPREELYLAKSAYQTYLKLDTHCTSVGGYIATLELYKQLGKDIVGNQIALEDLTITPYEKNAGDLMIMAGYVAGEKGLDTDYAITYKTDVEILSSFGETEGEVLYRSTSSANSPYKLTFIGDSYRLAMREFLEKDFGSVALDCYVNLPGSDITADVKDTDILVIEMVEKLTTWRFEEVMTNMIYILSQE